MLSFNSIISETMLKCIQNKQTKNNMKSIKCKSLFGYLYDCGSNTVTAEPIFIKLGIINVVNWNSIMAVQTDTTRENPQAEVSLCHSMANEAFLFSSILPLL